MEKHGYKLYELVGVHYRLPVQVRRETETMVRVGFTDTPLLARQKKVLLEFFNQHGNAIPTAHVWIMKEEVFLEYCVKSKFTEAEDVVVWNWIEQAIPDMPDFFVAYCQSRDAIFRNPAAVRMIWESFCKFSIWWVTRKGQTLDLGFVKLAIAPVRRNWAEIFQASRRSSSRFVGFNEKELIKKTIQSGKLSAFDKRLGIIKWDILATPTARFYNTMKVIELERKRGTTFRYYVKKVKELILNYEGRIRENFSAYLEETSHPIAPISAGVGGRAIQRGRERAEFNPQVETQAGDPLAGGDHLDQGGASGEKNVVGEDAQVPALSTLQSNHQDVRDAGNDVETTGEGNS